MACQDLMLLSRIRDPKCQFYQANMPCLWSGRIHTFSEAGHRPAFLLGCGILSRGEHVQLENLIVAPSIIMRAKLNFCSRGKTDLALSFSISHEAHKIVKPGRLRCEPVQPSMRGHLADWDVPGRSIRGTMAPGTVGTPTPGRSCSTLPR